MLLYGKTVNNAVYYNVKERMLMITKENTKTLFDLAINAGKEYGERTFLRYIKGEDLFERTYTEFAEDTKAMACYISELNNEIGHKVHAALFGTCGHRYLISMLGVAAAGGISVPVDVQLSNEALIDRLNEADIDVLFFDVDLHPKLSLIHEKCPNIKHFICFQNLNGDMGYNLKTAKNIIFGYNGKPFTPDVNEDDVAIIIYTSGTTGKSKGVMLSHKNLISNMFSSEEPERHHGETCLNVLPIHHVFCISGDVLLMARYGDTLCICPDISKLVHYINLFKPITIRMVPMMVKMLVNRAAIYKTEHPELTMEQVKNELYGEQLYRLISGGGYLEAKLAKKVFDMGMVTGQGYGMSECSPKISAPDYGNLEKLESVGKVVDGCTVRVVDGEIQVSSPSVMLGYYKEPELTKEAITEDGWLRTGDLGYVDEDGFIYLTGRKKNLIILSNGENVSPEMIEKTFASDILIADIVAYGQGEIIAAEIYPNYEYAQVNKIDNIEEAVNEIVAFNNQTLPTYARIAKVTIRKVPFKKNSSKKIMREAFFEEKKREQERVDTARKPETERQKAICDIVAQIIGHRSFGIDTNLYECGLDSLGSIMLIEEVYKRLELTITLNDLLECKTILGFEKIMDEKQASQSKYDYTKRERYTLTKMQLYFGYVIRGNTTGNLPMSFRFDKRVDLPKLKQAILDVIDAHPTMKASIRPGTDNPYLGLYRRDDFVYDIPIIQLRDDECLKQLESDLVPFKYDGTDNLCHIKLYETEKAKYLFFDLSHIMGDGVSINIVMEDICKRYAGEEVQKEKFTFFDFTIEENAREEEGIYPRDRKKVAELLDGLKLQRSILNVPGIRTYEVGHYSAIRKRFNRIIKKEFLNFCQEKGVTENVMFLTAFNYCISLFSDEKDVFANSIHSGRTDSRFARMVGPLFQTYYTRYTQLAHETVDELLKKTGNQIMNSMKSTLTCAREGEMFFQYQGDLMEPPKIGGYETERVRQQLDSLPFHMQVMTDKDGYYYELRYWENRFDKKLLEIFLDCYESILVRMLSSTSVRRLKEAVPDECIPIHFTISVKELNKAAGGKLLIDVPNDEMVKVYVLDENYVKKPFGAWGSLYIQGYQPLFGQQVVENPFKSGVFIYKTNRTARIMPDGSVDFLEDSGRTVLIEDSTGRTYYDLITLEYNLLAIPSVAGASAYLQYEESINNMRLHVDLQTVKIPGVIVTEDSVKEYVKEKLGEQIVPEYVHIW